MEWGWWKLPMRIGKKCERFLSVIDVSALEIFGNYMLLAADPNFGQMDGSLRIRIFHQKEAL